MLLHPYILKESEHQHIPIVSKTYLTMYVTNVLIVRSSQAVQVEIGRYNVLQVNCFLGAAAIASLDD